MNCGLCSGVVGSTVGLQLEGPGFESQPGVLMNGVYRSQGISCDNKIKP